MKMEVHNASVVSAYGARSSGLRDEDSLDLLMAPCDRFPHAAFAAPALPGLPRPVKMEDDASVPLAKPDLTGALL
jgi:hypothetical protein